MKQTKPYQNLRLDRNSIINLEKGKIPPQAIDLEEVVLGAMMIDKKGVDEVIDILNSEAFYKESHQYIFEAILSLFENSEPIDLLTSLNMSITTSLTHYVNRIFKQNYERIQKNWIRRKFIACC